MNNHNISLSDVRVHKNLKFYIILVPLGLNLAPGRLPVSFSTWKQITTVEDRNLETKCIWILALSMSNNEDLSPVVTTSNQNRKQSKTEQTHGTSNDGISPFPPKSDHDRSSPYNTNTITSRKVVRIKKNVHKEITSWSKTKLSKTS